MSTEQLVNYLAAEVGRVTRERPGQGSYDLSVPPALLIGIKEGKHMKLNNPPGDVFFSNRSQNAPVPTLVTYMPTLPSHRSLREELSQRTQERWISPEKFRKSQCRVRK